MAIAVQAFLGRAKRFLSLPWLPYALLWAALTAYHFSLVLGTGDDAMYRQLYLERGFWGWLSYSYGHWSGRTFIDMGILLLNHLPETVWRLLNPVMIVLCAAALSSILNAREKPPVRWLVCGCMLLYPWAVLSSAGWITTTVVFVWPAAAALLALIPASRYLRGQRVNTAAAVLCGPLFLYAANMEQLGAVCVALTGALAVWLAARKKLSWAPVLHFCMALAGLLWNITAPGTAARYETERTSWFIAFEMKPFLSKAELGVSLALRDLLFSPNFIFFVFCVLAAWSVFRQYKNIFYRLCAVLPLIVATVFGYLQGLFAGLIPRLEFFTNAIYMDGTITLENSGSPKAYLPLILLCGTAAVCLVNIYLALGHTRGALLAGYVFALGFASHAVLGFSPTANVSGPRTGFFFSLCIVAVSGYMLRHILTTKRRRYLSCANALNAR